MSVIKLAAFSGEQPRVIPRLMAANAAQEALNVRLDDGSLKPVRAPALVRTFPNMSASGYKTIRLAGDTWMGWEQVVHVAPGPVAQDRLYWTGDGKPKVRVAGVTYDLAVRPPVSALAAAVSGAATDASIVSARVYVHTYVTDFGEETEPSPASVSVNWSPGQTVTLSGFAAAPAGRAITKQRIYRSQTGSAGTDLYFIAERAVATTNFVDTLASDVFAEVIPSKHFNAPPDDLDGLIPIHAGMMAAFIGKDVYFCEPYRPHAWPEKYVLTTTDPIVALGAFGSSVLVMTTGQPVLISGSTPEAMTVQTIEANLPCINARAVVDLGYGVAYPSNDGLVLASSGGINLVSQKLFTPTDWRRLNPGTMVAAQINSRYIASFNTIDDDGNAVAQSLAIDLTGGDAFLVRYDVRTDAWYSDVSAGRLYYLADGTANVMEFDPADGDRTAFFWRSKQFLVPYEDSYAAILVEVESGVTQAELDARASAIAAALATNAALIVAGSLAGTLASHALNVVPLGGDLLQEVPGSRGLSCEIGVYADGVLIATVGAVNRMVRLPASRRGRKWEITAAGDLIIEQISMASTVDELRSAPQ